MNEMYGHQWASQQGDEPNDTWIKGLMGVTPSEYAVGLRALLRRIDTWPPNLPEFRQLCTSFDPEGWRHRAERQNNESLAIDKESHKTDAAQEAGRKFFEQMRQKGLVL